MCKASYSQILMTFQDQFQLAKNASYTISKLTSEKKKSLLLALAHALDAHTDDIIRENKKDVAAAIQAGKEEMVDRLLLDANRISAISRDVRNVADLPDEIGRVIEENTRPNGLQISRIRVPIGVIGMIYESRPNVTVDAAVLALKSGNAILLKGGKEAIYSNRILVHIMKEALLSAGVNEHAIEFLDTTDRQATAELLSARGLVDVIIPRGGKGLIRFVIENAKIPVIETGASVVHTYVDSSADIKKAVDIVVNEKTRRVTVCNALDTILVHKDIAEEFLEELGSVLVRLAQENGIPLVDIYADETSMSYLSKMSYKSCFKVKQSDFETEWLRHAMSVCTVQTFDEALKHIRQYSLGHSESICAEDPILIERFLHEVDSACVYANASTAFSDGAEFGLGAEIGISTQKLHVRGPFALQGLTSTKWVIRGDGQTRE